MALAVVREYSCATWLPEQDIPIRGPKARKQFATSNERRYTQALLYPRRIFIQCQYIPVLIPLHREGARWITNAEGLFVQIPDYQLRIWQAEIARLNDLTRALGKITPKAKRKWKQLHEALAELKDPKQDMEEAA